MCGQVSFSFSGKCSLNFPCEPASNTFYVLGWQRSHNVLCLWMKNLVILGYDYRRAVPPFLSSRKLIEGNFAVYGECQLTTVNRKQEKYQFRRILERSTSIFFIYRTANKMFSMVNLKYQIEANKRSLLLRFTHTLSSKTTLIGRTSTSFFPYAVLILKRKIPWDYQCGRFICQLTLGEYPCLHMEVRNSLKNFGLIKNFSMVSNYCQICTYSICY